MRVAAIDVGTNSIHLLVADVSAEGQISVVEKAREQVMLGRGGIGQRTIAQDAFDRGVEALAAFKIAADGLGCEDIHAAATSAVREASNGQAFCEAVKRRTGIHVRQISGADEARLIWLGARAEVDVSDGPVLLFDVGGGSTEFILATAAGPRMTVSLPLGHIRLSEKHGVGGAFDTAARKATKKAVRKALTALTSRLGDQPIARVVGTSGTVRCLARIATLARGEALPPHGSGLVLRRRDVEAFLGTVEGASRDAIAALPGMDGRRVDTLPAGAVIVREVLKATGAAQLTTLDRSLRDGLVIDWIERHRPEIDLQRTVLDPRARSTILAMRRFAPNERHARHVAELTTTLFDRLAPLHGLPSSDRDLAWSAAMLHDIGHHIAGRGHHRHGMYLLQHIRMPGFTAPETAVLAQVVRYHSRSRPKASHDDFQALPPEDQRRVTRLAGLLRIADALDRSHDQPVTALDVSWDDQAIRVDATMREGGELEHWAVAQRHDVLAKALHRDIHLRILRPDGRPADRDDVSAGTDTPGEPRS